MAIKNSVGTFITELAFCNIATTSCTVPISVLQATPYTLVWGDSIYATVLATNSVGSSAASDPGNGAVITTYPNPPSLLANNAGITSTTVIGLTWVSPTVFGGTAVINYEVGWD